MATITTRGKSYLIRVSDGYSPDGHQITRSKTWRPPESWSKARADKEVKHQAALFEEQVKSGQTIDSNLKFQLFADLWMKTYAMPNLKSKTLNRYNGLLKRINQAFGHIPLAKLNPQHFMRFYADLVNTLPDNVPYRCTVSLKLLLKEQGMTQAALAKQAGISTDVPGSIIRGNSCSYKSACQIAEALGSPLETLFAPSKSVKPLSPTTVHHYHRLITDILNAAVKWGYLTSNPATKVTAPKTRYKDALYLDADQARQLTNELKRAPDVYHQAILLLLLTGMRRGELLGLEWRDINWEQRYIQISRASYYTPEKGVYTDTTKNESSDRIIMIPTEAIGVLKKQWNWQVQQSLQNPKWVHSGRVIVSEDGTPMHPDRLTRWFPKFIATTDLPPITLHSLRHTYATLLIEKQIPVTDVSAQLGHSNVTTTMNIYAHAIRKARIAAADQLGDIFSDIV